MSSIISSVIASSTSFLPLTTPFVPPPLCRTVQDLTITATTSSMRNGDQVTNPIVPYLFSNPANADYGACLPTPLRQTYSPGVCPLSWTAYWMTSIWESESSTTMSTARCCMSGFTVGKSYGGTFARGIMCTAKYGAESDAQYGPTSVIVTLSGGGTPTATTVFSTGIIAHPAWVIAWQKKDQRTLSPQPPDLTLDMMIPTWTAGQYIERGKYNHGGSGKREGDYPDQGLVHFVRFIMIGIPIIVVFLIASCCYCCCWKKTPIAKRRAKAKAERAALENANQPEQGGDALPPPYLVHGGDQPLPAYTLTTMTPATK